MYHAIRPKLTKLTRMTSTTLPCFLSPTAIPLQTHLQSRILRNPLQIPRNPTHRRVHAHPLPCIQTPLAVVQQETTWNPVKVLENSPICEDHRYIVIDVGTTDSKGSLADTYRVPGMYVQIRENDSGKPVFLSISCAPNIQGIFEFLVKEADNIKWLTGVDKGDIVHMSPVMGPGFPIQKLDLLSFPPIPEQDSPKDILLFATGSGIAPIRAAIESLLNGLRIPQRRSVKLFYGARYPERMAYMDRFKLWQQDGVEIIPVMSQPQLGKTEWNGRTGYIQEALKDIGVQHPKQTGALLCGVKGMTQDVTQILVDAGVPEERILMNF